MAQSTSNRTLFEIDLGTLTVLHWMAILLTTFTGVVHLYLFQQQGWMLFLLGGLGYLVAVGLMTFVVLRKWIILGLIPYTLVHIVGYFVQEAPDSIGDMTTIAIVDKVAEGILVLLLIYLFWESYRQTGLKI